MTQPFDDIRGKIQDAITAISAAQATLDRIGMTDSKAELESLKRLLTIYVMHKGWLWHLEHGEDVDVGQ